jgi:EmrB/QacA subfamily drug resistance transporter
VLVATILGSSLVFIDGTVVNVALPAIQRDLGATVAGAQWIVEAYALLLAALLLVGGAAGDRFGRRRVFVIGVGLFSLASLWCALAPDVATLVAARAAQGVAGALLVPGSLAILSASFVDAARGRAIGVWSGYTALTSALGPVIGGLVIDHLSWRYAFLINVPFGVIVVAIALRRLPESRGAGATGPLDWRGAGLATLGLGSGVFGLIESQSRGWTDPVAGAALLAGAAALAAFLAVEHRHAAPMLPLALFRHRAFAGANLMTLFLYAALGGSLFFFPLNLIQVQGYTAAQAGGALLPFVLTMFLLSARAGALADRFGARLPLTVGPAVAGVGFVLFAVPGVGGTYWTTYFPAVLVLGLGMTISVAPLTTTVMNAVDRGSAGVASGVNNAVSRVAALLAIAVLGILMTRVFDRELDARLARIAAPAAAVAAVAQQRAKLGAIEVGDDLDAATRAALRGAVDAAFVSGFRRVMGAGAALALAAALAAWLTIDGRRTAPPLP